MKWGKTLSLPKGWEIKKLGEVCDFKSGTTISPSLEREVGDVLYLKVGDMNLPENEIEINTSSRFVNRNEIKQVQIIPEGAVIFPKRGGAIATNKKRKVIQPTIVDLNTMAIIPTNKLDSDYFYYWFQMIDLNDISNGTSIPQINNYSFDDIYIQYPKSLSEQQRIVSILDECFAAINKAKANAEQNLKNAKELFESYLQGVFEKKGDGWEEQLLEDCFKMKSGDNLTAKNMSEGEYPVFGGNGIAGYHNEYNLSGSNVIIGRVGALCGNVRHITENIWLTDNAFKVVDFKFDFDHSFLTYLLNHKDLRSYARQAAQPVISNSSLKDVVLNFPKSKKEQQTIVRQLDALRAETQKLEAVYQKKIVDLEELKKSILQKAFAGELRSPEGAGSDSEVATPLAGNDGHNPSEKKLKNKVSPERA